MILHFIIVTIFIIFAIRFLIVNSLKKKEARLQFLKSAILVIYYFPVFLQGLFLLYFSLMISFVVVKEFYFFLYALVFKSENAGGDTHPLLLYLSVIVFGSLLLSFNTILAKISANKSFKINAIFIKICYILFSLCMLALLKSNLPFLSPFNFTLDELYFYNNIYVMILGALICVLLLILPYFFKSNNKFFNYAVLSVRVSISYFLFCMSIAVAFFLFFVFFHLIGALASINFCT